LRFSDSPRRRKLRQISRIYFPFCELWEGRYSCFGALKNFHNHNSVLELVPLLPLPLSKLLRLEDFPYFSNRPAIRRMENQYIFMGSCCGCTYGISAAHTALLYVQRNGFHRDSDSDSSCRLAICTFRNSNHKILCRTPPGMRKRK